MHLSRVKIRYRIFDLKMDIHDTQILLLNILAFLLVLTSMQPLLFLNEHIPLQQRLLPNFHGHGFNGRDVYTLIINQPWLFWRNTGETLQSFNQLVADISPVLLRLTAEGQPRIRQCRQHLSITNQVLLVLIWLISSC